MTSKTSIEKSIIEFLCKMRVHGIQIDSIVFASDNALYALMGELHLNDRKCDSLAVIDEKPRIKSLTLNTSSGPVRIKSKQENQ